MTNFSVIRKHEIHSGHRIYGHEGQCSHLHGHSYIFHFHCTSNQLNNIGMVVDFSVIKYSLCQWLDENYDHRLLLWEKDPIAKEILQLDMSVVIVPYNPTAENLARHMLYEVAPKLLLNSNIRVTKVVVEESSKCSASCEI